MVEEYRDPEQRFLQELATIEEFKEAVKSLEVKVEDLTRRVESLELLGFQEQLDRLNERINEISKALLETQRELASLEVASLRDTCGLHPDVNTDIFNRIHLDSRTALATITAPDSPLLVAGNFRHDCYKLLDKAGLDMY